MAHELDRKADGTGAMFSVRATPWHEEGTVLADAPTLADALTLGGLDFEVDLRRVYMNVNETQLVSTDANPLSEVQVPTMVEVPDAFAAVRTDRDAVLGVVGSRYTPLQNADAFRVLEPLLDAGVAELETGGSLRGGRDVWMMVRFNIDNPVVQEVFADEVVPFGLVSNNHSGDRGVTLKETPIRVVCANTLGFAHRRKGRGVKVRHTSSVASRTVEAAEALWTGVVDRYVRIARAYRSLQEHYLRREEFERLVLNVVAPMPAKYDDVDTTDLDPRSKAAMARITARRERLLYLWRNGDGHVGNDTAWEAYNAVTQSVDHDTDLWQTRTDSRLEALAGGRLEQVKNDALASLIKVAA